MGVLGQTTLFDENEIVHRKKTEGVQSGVLVPWVKRTPTDTPAP